MKYWKVRLETLLKRYYLKKYTVIPAVNLMKRVISHKKYIEKRGELHNLSQTEEPWLVLP